MVPGASYRYSPDSPSSPFVPSMPTRRDIGVQVEPWPAAPPWQAMPPALGQVATTQGRALPRHFGEAHLGESVADADSARVDRWFHNKAKDDRRPVDAKAIAEIRQQIRHVHDAKHRGLPDAHASVEYAKLGKAFLQASGVTPEAQGRAVGLNAATGLWWSLQQLAEMPVDLIPGVPTLLKSVMLHGGVNAHSGYHVGIGGVLSPLFTTLADLTKDGQPVPGDWWTAASRGQVVDVLTRTADLAQATFDACREAGKPVPDGVLETLTAARNHYVNRNAKDFVYGAGSFVSGAFGFIKNVAGLVATSLTAGAGKVVSRPALNALTAAVYAASGPLEEMAAMRVLATENAKYANVFDAAGQVDEAKVRALWMSRTQVQAQYVEKAVQRHLAHDLHELQDAKGQLAFLEKLKTSPSARVDELLARQAATRAQIEWVQSRIKNLEPFVDKDESWEAAFIQSLQGKGAPEEVVKALKDLFAGSIERAGRKNGLGPQAYDLKAEATGAFLGFMQRAASGKHLMIGLKTKLALLQRREADIEYQLGVASKGRSETPRERAEREDRLALQVADQQRRIRKHDLALERMVSDLAAFKAGNPAGLSRDGLIFGMLSSTPKLFKEAIAAKYSDPSVLKSAIAAQSPIAADLLMWLDVALDDPLAQRAPLTGSLGMPAPFSHDLRTALAEVGGWAGERLRGVPAFDLGDYPHKYGVGAAHPQGHSNWAERSKQSALSDVRFGVAAVRQIGGLPSSLLRGKMQNERAKALMADIVRHNQAHAAAPAARYEEGEGPTPPAEDGVITMRF